MGGADGDAVSADDGAGELEGWGGEAGQGESENAVITSGCGSWRRRGRERFRGGSGRWLRWFERRRIGARADVLLLDEPFTGLDAG